LADGIAQGSAVVVERDGRNTMLLRWCLSNGLHIVQPMTLMSIGLYNEPDGAWMPSVSF
jgi:hypothetical protein